jgi:hypothetical protein
VEFSNDYALLNEIYKTGAMGSAAIELILPKVKSPRFRTDLKRQNDQYQTIEQEAEEALSQMGKCPQELSMGQRAMLQMGIMANTMCNRETSHLAELMIQGSNMGILALTKVLNSNQEEESPVRDLASRTLAMEEENIRRMKCYLQ